MNSSNIIMAPIAAFLSFFKTIFRFQFKKDSQVCVILLYLFVRLLQVFHEDGNYHVDQYKLCHEHENDKKQRGKVGRDATVSQTVVSIFAFFPQSVFHDAVPVVTRGYSEQCEKGHSEGSEMSMLTQTLTGMKLITFCERKIKQTVVRKPREKFGCGIFSGL